MKRAVWIVALGIAALLLGPTLILHSVRDIRRIVALLPTPAPTPEPACTDAQIAANKDLSGASGSPRYTETFWDCQPTANQTAMMYAANAKADAADEAAKKAQEAAEIRQEQAAQQAEGQALQQRLQQIEAEERAREAQSKLEEQVRNAKLYKDCIAEANATGGYGVEAMRAQCHALLDV
jgi:hypothetical protein